MTKKVFFLAFASLALSACQLTPMADQNQALKSQNYQIEYKNIPTMSDQANTKTTEATPSSQAVEAIMKTSLGDITLTLFPDKAPMTVENFIGLAKGTKNWKNPKTSQVMSGASLYANTIFHRVIPDFMIQGGDPLGQGTGGPGYQFKDEFDQSLKFDKPYLLAMANSGPNTNGSQFFITTVPTPWLNGKHTIFGIVTKGQDIVDKISMVKTDSSDKPLTDVVLNSIEIIEK